MSKHYDPLDVGKVTEVDSFQIVQDDKNNNDTTIRVFALQLRGGTFVFVC